MPEELDEPEVWLLDPDVVAVPVEVPVEKPEDTLVPVVAVPVAVETAAELPDPEAEPLVVGESGTTGDESPAGMDAGAGWEVTTSGWLVTALGWEVTAVGCPVTTPRELVSVKY